MSTTNRAGQPEQGTVQSRQFFSPRLCNTGGCGALDSAAGNNSTPVATELYLAELVVPFWCKVRGISVFNGSDDTDNKKAGLYDAEGTLLAASATTTSGTADTYHNLPFALDGANATFVQLILQPGTYYIGTCYASNTSRYNTFAVGNFGAGKITGLVYATNFATTALTVAVPRTFTTALGPIASLY